MSYLVCCPYVHRPTFDRMWDTLAPDLRQPGRALIIDNTVDNLGAAGSRNFGARLVLELGLDWLVDVSPVVRFGPSGGHDFLDQLQDHEGSWVVQSSAPVNWHLMAWSRTVFERVGLFDENFWPVYGEDGDMSYRIHQAAREDERADRIDHAPHLAPTWACVDVDAWVTKYGHSVTDGGVTVDYDRIWGYYETKWGGRSGHETLTRPFGFLDKGLDWWPSRGHPLALRHKGRP